MNCQNERFLIDNLPYPPSENDIYSDGKPYKTKDGKWRVNRFLNTVGTNYKRDVSKILVDSGLTTRLREFLEYHQTVDFYIYLYRPNWYTQTGRPSKGPGDASNRIKILQDVLFEAVGIDDCVAFSTNIRKVFGETPKANVVFTKEMEVVDFFR